MNLENISSPQYASQSKPLPLKVIAQAIGAKLVGEGDVIIENVGTIQSAHKAQITFLNNSDQYHKYRQHLADTQASALITTQGIFEQERDLNIPLLIHDEPRQAIVKVVHLLFPKLQFSPSIHPSVVVGEGAEIHPKTFIGPNVVIGKNVIIEENVIIQANCIIGDDSIIGKSSFLHPNVNIYSNCHLGQQCVIHSGVVIGSDGFGFVRNGAHWVKVPQIGGVRIGERVEIGANTTIDRGAIDHTVIEDDVILDNLIQIGHNVKIGKGTAIAACAGIAGSSVIGQNCLIGGASNINGHINITNQVSIVGCSNVGKSITESGAYASGLTVTDMRTWKKNLVRFHQLDKIANRLAQVELQLQSEKGA